MALHQSSSRSTRPPPPPTSRSTLASLGWRGTLTVSLLAPLLTYPFPHHSENRLFIASDRSTFTPIVEQEHKTSVTTNESVNNRLAELERDLHEVATERSALLAELREYREYVAARICVGLLLTECCTFTRPLAQTLLLAECCTFARMRGSGLCCWLSCCTAFY